MYQDSAAAIRLEAIYAFVRAGADDAGRKLTAALLDPAASVRLAARYYLREAKIAAASDFVGHYRRNLSGGTGRLVAAIAGLAETGTGEDAPLLDPWLEHPSARVVRATLIAHTRLDPEGTRRHRLAALVDHRAGVGRQALRLLDRRLRAADAAVLQALAASVTTADAADTLARAAAKLPVWIDLLALLWLAALPDTRLRESANRELEAWMPKGRPSYALPAPDLPTRREIAARLASARSFLPPPVALGLDRLLNPWI
jgi:hypothetical protein